MASRTFTWEFDSPPEAVWPAIADTARFNEAAGLPRHRIQEQEQPDRSVRYFAEAKMGPIRLAWEEIPVEWVRNRWFRHERRFSRGPLRVMTAEVALEPTEAGCRCIYTLTAEPRGLFGRLILAGGFFSGTEKTFDRLVSGIREFAARRAVRPYMAGRLALPDAREARRLTMVERLTRREPVAGLADRLSDHLLEGLEVDLATMRPKALAREWGVPTLAAVELCLEGVRAGLLGSRWDLLCPRCRGAKATVDSLEDLPVQAHCESCNITYDRDFARNVELSFHPSPSIRSVPDGEFCLFGPMSLPHILAQVTVDPGDTRAIDLVLPRGDYRYRTLEIGGAVDLDIGSGEPAPSLILNGSDVTLGPAPEDPGQLWVKNEGKVRRTAVIESRDWVADALTAHEATTVQVFRDLFPEQILKPGDEISIHQVAILFTDLAGSTAMFERIGDATAYRRVREHFGYLAETVRVHQGAIVKTIGDAVMAAFADPGDAVAAAIRAQRELGGFNARSDGVALALKIGVHAGPCIAVTLNERLDYFGGMVNLAARLQGQAQAGEIVLSDSIAGDPAVAPLLETVAAVDDRARVRGVAEPVSFKRLRVAGDPASVTTGG